MADPVADFLAREQDMFAEFNDAPPPVEVSEPATANIEDEFGSMAIAPHDVPAIVESDAVVNEQLFDSSAFTADVDIPSEAGFGEMNSSSNSVSKGPSPVFSMPRIEAENIRKWREEQVVLLEKKDEAEERKKQELKIAATKELDEWYAQRDATLKGTREANRKAEEEHLAAFGREQGESAQWDEIARLCEAKAQRGGRDLSRLKSLLLHLKEQHKK